VNKLDAYEQMEGGTGGRPIMLLNNLNSFSLSRERASEFGDSILEAEVPLAKIFFFTRLLPGLLPSEDEIAVLGGLYEVTVRKY
jgi:NAD+--dinitrogen-reductase ADP-D-ribosyltransferase